MDGNILNNNIEEQYKLLIAQMPLGLAVHKIICDDKGHPIDYEFISVNKKFEEQTGLKAEDIIGKTVLSVLPNTEKYWIETYGKVALTGDTIKYDNYSAELNKYFSVAAYRPKLGQFAVITSDITKIKYISQKLVSKTNELERFFSINLDLLCIADMDANIIRTNLAWHTVLGYSEESLKYKKLTDFVYSSDMPKAMNALSKLKNNEQILNFVIQFQCTDKSYKYLEWNLLPSNGLIYAAARDITERQQKQDEIEYLSFHDYLTGLYNRRYMDDTISRLDVERNLPFTVMILDVNGLKLTNDIFGHKTGDQLLITVANILTGACRAEDIICRIGGDEFAILLPNTSAKQANLIKQRIKEDASVAKMDEPIVVSIAIGFATKTHKDEAIDIIKMNADAYMYEDKQEYGQTMKVRTINQVVNKLNLEYHSEKIHADMVSEYCKIIGKLLNFNELEIRDITQQGLLHDIGKVVIPSEVMNKSGELTIKEIEQIKRHPRVGYQILQSVNEFAVFSVAILHHHERWDGKGYPEGLAGENIPLESRIIAIADAYTNMIESRNYRKAKTKEEAILELRKGSGTQFDPDITKIFIDYLCNRKVPLIL